MVQPDEAIFYLGLNLTGNAYHYKLGASVAFKPDDVLNDKLMSVDIGSNVWVNAYENNDVYNPGGVHEELQSGVHNDLSSLKGLSKFQVLQNAFKYAIDISLTDPVNGAGGSELTFKPYQVEPVKVLSGAPAVQCPIPKLGTPADIVCQVSVRKTAWPGETVANGSIYMSYDEKTGLISSKTDANFPKNMTVTQTGLTNFEFKLTSNTP
eukprot:gene11345-13892_t